MFQDPAGPAAAFLTALLQRQPQTVQELLDENVTAQIPSLGFTCDGRAEITAVLGAVLTAFSEVRYDVRHRYISPGSLTDEVMLTARRHGQFLDHPPDNQPVHLPARVQVDHNGTTITSLALWADRQALHDLIRTPAAGSTGVLSVVSALRATMPRQDARLTVGTNRQLPLLPYEAPEAILGPGTQPTEHHGHHGNRTSSLGGRRRVAAWGLGTIVLLTVVALTAWTVRIAMTDHKLSTQAPVSAASPSTTPTTTDSLPSGVVFSQDTHSYDLSSDILFSPDSANLTVRAQEILSVVVGQVRLARPTGVITVTGYTDTTGDAAYNLALSERRARVVAEVLTQGLTDVPDLSIVPYGAGETGTARDNDTPVERAANRRVTIALPPPAGTPTSAATTVTNGGVPQES